MIRERVYFRFLRLHCCGHLLCWVNPRWPSYCPSCGTLIYPDVKQDVLKSDEDAILEHNLR